MKYDKIFLKYTLKIACLGKFTTYPNPNVGCIIVKNNYIVGEGYHKNTGQNHAEIYALNMAGQMSNGATAYITLEPCSHYGNTPPCTNALINFGIKRVVIAMLDPNPKTKGKSLKCLKKAGIIIKYNNMVKEAKTINLGFIKRMCSGFPKITLKLASSIDGNIAMLSNESKWITSKESRNDVQYFRTKNDAILSTASTILIDNSTINVNWSSLKNFKFFKKKIFYHPIKILIDINNRININHKIIKNKKPTLLIKKQNDKFLCTKKIKQIIFPIQKKLTNIKKLDLILLMKQIGKQQINNIWIEAGANLAGSLLNEGLVDEFIIYIAPKLLGINTLPLCVIFNLIKLNEALCFKIKYIKKINNDIRIHLKPCIKY